MTLEFAKEGLCRTCQARILWVKSKATGKNIPLDPEPHQAGNITVDDDGYATVHKDTAPGRFRTHFVTCPDAAKHRRR